MPLQLPGPATPLHLYRHLLREVSYLPLVIRPRLSDRIKTMFRSHRKDENPGPRLRKANAKLRVVRAAVSGDRDRLQWLIGLAFGRRGFRRRQMLSDFLQLQPPDAEPPAEGAAFDAFVRDRHTHTPITSPGQTPEGPRYGALPGPDWLDKWDTTKLLRLLKLQAQSPGITIRPYEIRTKDMNPMARIAGKNSWGRPWPPKPARTKVRNWWAQMADKALPPLPQEEWELLQALSMGTVESGWNIVPRRPVAQGPGAESAKRLLASQMWDMEAYLLKPTRWVDRKSSRTRTRLTGIPQPNDEFGHAASTRSRSHGPPLSARSMRHIYLKVWQESPLMETDPRTPDKFTLQYGKAPPRTRPPGGSHARIFQGVDKNGVPIKPT